MTGLLQVTTATETKDQALTLVGGAVRQRLAASAQVVGPVTSAFWHLDEFGTGEEWSAILLTTDERYADLEAFIHANHPWQNPQLIAVAVRAASAANIDWARKALR
jgi:periplasmic divalent cation tolerance protein